jgi:hypothetical protein
MPRGDLDFPLPTLGLSSYRACDLWPGGVPCQQGQLPKDNFQRTTSRHFSNISVARCGISLSTPLQTMSSSTSVYLACLPTGQTHRLSSPLPKLWNSPGILPKQVSAGTQCQRQYRRGRGFY